VILPLINPTNIGNQWYEARASDCLVLLTFFSCFLNSSASFFGRFRTFSTPGNLPRLTSLTNARTAAVPLCLISSYRRLCLRSPSSKKKILHDYTTVESTFRSLSSCESFLFSLPFCGRPVEYIFD